MKFNSQNPLLMLALGLLLGGGIMQTAWMLRAPEKPVAAATADPAPTFRRPLSKSSRASDFRGKDRAVEKAKSISIKDPREAWQRAMRIENFAERLAFITTLMEDWGKTEPLAALEMAATLPAGQLKSEAYSAACGAWASLHPAAAAEWAASHLTGPLAGETFGTIASEWSASDPAAAAEWVSRLPRGAISDGATTSVITAWASRDPRAAAAWIAAIPDTERKSAAMATLAAEWCSQSPADAAGWVTAQLGNPAASDLADALVGSWGSQDPQAASAWVMRLPQEIQATAATVLLSNWASSDPKAAAAWAAKFPAGDTRNEAISTLALSWAATEPRNAVVWASSLADSPEQREALDDSVRAWAGLDPKDAGKWMDQQPPNETTDRLRTVTATALLETQPQDAMAMALKISDATKRDESFTRLLHLWQRESPDEAKAWATQAGYNNRLNQAQPSE